ncbi:SDR family oxidoreductase [Sulfurospirillum barnesii]|uniref:Short-chain alcohol dehydrogenase n=1 Tax=Sulfurospirillum barnesii (strain ATCC 700032 / DSM 10660 / SES-3) TaxID=760154 RepID=I3XUR4_SULBS|nr:SDR family oxidoreductase [Sulfurospirillum barnesii]AFL67688.1 short-chain alcohol dehydrogenase [Sulfurospirillum barnesii SES-3]
MAKIVFITGATSGFGEATAIKFAKAGYKVIATGRRQERLDALKAQLPKCDIVTLCFDVSKKEEVFNAVASLPEAYQAIDILVNNAGLALGLEHANEASLDDWERMIDTNIKGLLYVTKAVLPIMVKRKTGYIFNLGSTAGSWPYEGGNVYGATKAFVKQFSLNLRTDLKGTHVRVTNIEPGFSLTEFSDVRFKGDTQKAASVYKDTTPLSKEDIANTIFSLAELPEHVNVNRIEIMPTVQSYAGLSVERNN